MATIAGARKQVLVGESFSKYKFHLLRAVPKNI